MKRRVAIVGAGMAAAACARVLLDAGFAVYVFEKSRGPGGRTACRRADDLAFDHGAQFFTARDPGFRLAVADAAGQGACARWPGRWAVQTERGWQAEDVTETRWVGTPGMNRFAAHLLHGAITLFGKRVGAVRAYGSGVALSLADDHEQDGLAVYDAAVITAPAPQALALLPDTPELHPTLESVEYAPCWALMLGLRRPAAIAFDALRWSQGPLGWAARNSAKPGRNAAPECWVAHASPAWSREHTEASPQAVEAALLAALAPAVGSDPDIVFARAHRWRYARVMRAAGHPFGADDSGRIVVCGDGWLGARVENAYLSGEAAAGRLLAALA